MPDWIKRALLWRIEFSRLCSAEYRAAFPALLARLRERGISVLLLPVCFDSPFSGVGPDVRDHQKISSLCGGNAAVFALLSQAHRQGIRVLLPLISKSTSTEHLWFRMSCKKRVNDYSNRYLWSDAPEEREQLERAGTYAVDEFGRPLLNYGFLHPENFRQLPMEHSDCIASRAALKETMRFWLDRGFDGFLAVSPFDLVQSDDAESSGTCAVWRDIRQMLDCDYPAAVLLAANSPPPLLRSAGFHAALIPAFSGKTRDLFLVLPVEQNDRP